MLMACADSFGSSYASSFAADALGAGVALAEAAVVVVADVTGVGFVAPELPPPHAHKVRRHAVVVCRIGAP
jgi:hypothetical protein